MNALHRDELACPTAGARAPIGWALFDGAGNWCSWEPISTLAPSTWADPLGAARLARFDKAFPDQAPFSYDSVFRGTAASHDKLEAAIALLDEVRAACTRDDDLPDGLLGRIDQLVDGVEPQEGRS